MPTSFLVRTPTNTLSKFPVNNQLLIIKKRKILGGLGYSAQTPRKHSLSNRILEKIDREASKQKRSRSEFLELHFETLFFAKQELEN